MRPIETRLQDVIGQALYCVRYRVAPLRELRPTAFIHALALRYGLLGAAAVCYSVEPEHPAETVYAYEWSSEYGPLVSSHLRQELLHRFPLKVPSDRCVEIARLAHEALIDALPSPENGIDFAAISSAALDRHLARYSADIRREWPFWKAGYGEARFMQHAYASQRYAVAFLERRRAGLSEVSEIALLDE
jgi:hypothetical protein